MVKLGHLEERIQDHLVAIRSEYRRARSKWPAMRGAHEGYAVILEEVEEFWDEVKADNLTDARKEITQVAAMCLAFLVEVGDES